MAVICAGRRLRSRPGLPREADCPHLGTDRPQTQAESPLPRKVQAALRAPAVTGPLIKGSRPRLVAANAMARIVKPAEIDTTVCRAAIAGLLSQMPGFRILLLKDEALRFLGQLLCGRRCCAGSAGRTFVRTRACHRRGGTCRTATGLGRLRRRASALPSASTSCHGLRGLGR